MSQQLPLFAPTTVGLEQPLRLPPVHDGVLKRIAVRQVEHVYPPILGGPLLPADVHRLRRQLDVVRDYMLTHTHAWLTLGEISTATDQPEASVSARLRDLRRANYWVERRRRHGPTAGLHEYRVIKPADGRVYA